VGARVLIAPRRVGTVDHGEIAMQVAAENFTIRFVCGFGDGLPDGVMPLNHVFDTAVPTPAQPAYVGAPADHIAVLTFDVTADGLVPVARSHAELVAAGATIISEIGASTCSAMIGTLTASSLAGLASTVMPWLITGGTLVLHHPFSAQLFAQQCATEHCTLAVLPGPLVRPLCEAGLIGESGGPGTILAVWRAPERLATSPRCSDAKTLVDVCVFGEVGLLARRRGEGAPGPVVLRTSTAGPRVGTPVAIEFTRTAGGTLALQGALVPGHPFPPDIDRQDPLSLKIDEDGFVDTGYPCRCDGTSETLVLTGPPAGMVSVGGYRFSLSAVQKMLATIDEKTSIAALPDLLAGHRLAGVTEDRTAIREALAARGANPLIAAAFRERGS
jgi:hypothetical protein